MGVKLSKGQGKKSAKENRKQQKQSSQFVGMSNDEPHKISCNPNSACSSGDLYPALPDYQNCAGGVSRNENKENLHYPELVSSHASKENSSSSRMRASKSSTGTSTSSHVDHKLSFVKTRAPDEFCKKEKARSTGVSQSSSNVDLKCSTDTVRSAQYDSYEGKTRSRSKGARSGPGVASGPSNIDAREKSIQDYKYAPSAPVLDSDSWSYDRSLQSLRGNLTADHGQNQDNFPPKLRGNVSESCRSENHKFKNGGKPDERKAKQYPLKNIGSRDQDANRRRSKSSNVEGFEEKPPKYEEVIKQSASSMVEVLQNNNKANDKVQPLNVNFVSKKAKRSAEQVPGVQNSTGITRVEELNDRIKKQFGSVGGIIESLSNVDMSDKPFPGRNRLFIRNLPPNTTRNDLEELLSRYSEITMDFNDNETRTCCLRVKQQAEEVLRNLHGYKFKGRTLRVHFDNRDVRFKVLNLEEWVTNELLKKAFSIFGEVERAEVFLDKDGYRTGTGYLEFANKNGGQRAYEACQEGCFVLTASLRPVSLSKINPDVGCCGNYESNQLRRNGRYFKERRVGPRFVHEGSSEYKYAILWKELIERRRIQQEELEKKFLEEEERVCAQIELLMKS